MTTASSVVARGARFRWTVLGVVTAAHALGSLSALAVAPLAPVLLDELRLSRA